MGAAIRALEEGTPWSNRAGLFIGLLKESVRKDMRESNAPIAFWDYCVERRARINNLTAKSHFKLHGTTPHTATLGTEGDISNLCQFGWYEWCYFRDHTAAFPTNREVLGRVLGPARGTGNEMCQWVLKANGRVVPRRSVRRLQVAEIHSAVEIKKFGSSSQCAADHPDRADQATYPHHCLVIIITDIGYMISVSIFDG